MSRKLSPRSSLEGLKREAKRWLQSLRDGDRDALARFAAAHPAPPPVPALRDVQLALARQLGFSGWGALREALAARDESARDRAIGVLLAAADQGDTAGVIATLDVHPDLVNERATLPGHTGRRSALHFAMNSGNRETIAALLARGADPNLRDDGDNAYPLHFAAERGDIEIVRALLAHGADPNGEGDTHELAVLGWATVFARTPNRELVSLLLQHGARHTMLSAVATGAVDAIRAIAGTSPSELERVMDTTNRRRRPLHLAVVSQQHDALRALLALGADPAARDAAGLTPLDQAALQNDRDMAETLLAHGAVLELPAAIGLGRIADAERLLRADPDALRPGGRWARLIVRASEKGRAETIALLLSHGADVGVFDDERVSVDSARGYTALHAAAFHGNDDAARVLMAHGARVSARDSRYWGTPVGWAAYAGHDRTRDLLLEGAIDLFDALQYGRLERVREILDTDPGAVDRPIERLVPTPHEPVAWLDGHWTPLAYGIVEGADETTLRLLLERGARLDVRDSRDRTLAALTIAAGREALVEALGLPT